MDFVTDGVHSCSGLDSLILSGKGIYPVKLRNVVLHRVDAKYFYLMKSTTMLLEI